MRVTDVKVTLMADSRKLLAFASVALDDALVIREFKILHDGERPHVVMPSRLRFVRCPQCRSRVPVRTSFCGDCGTRNESGARVKSGSAQHVDLAYPTNAEFREHLEASVLAAYQNELRRSRDRAASNASHDDAAASTSRGR